MNLLNKPRRVVFLAISFSLIAVLFWTFYSHSQSTSSQVAVRETLGKSVIKPPTLNKDMYINKALVENANYKNVKGIVIPHHLLARELILRALSMSDFSDVTTVVLVGPDHYFQVSPTDCGVTSNSDWETPFGTMNAFYYDKVTCLDHKDMPFLKEHSIFGLVPFINKIMPKAKILPVIVGDMQFQEYENLGKTIAEALSVQKENYLIVVSSDFTHEKPVNEATLQDSNSIQAISANNYSEIKSDCPQCFAFLHGMLETNFKNINFYPIDTSNSYYISNENPNSVTSYVTGYFIENSERGTKLLFGGDVMFDRSIRQVADKYGYDYLFSDIASVLVEPDFTVFNLEGPITNKPSISINSEIGSKNNYIFTFSPDVTDVLKNLNINLVSIGNNHILNQGYEGIESTKEYLNGSNVSFIGSENTEILHSVVINDKNYIFVSYNEFSSDTSHKNLVKDAIANNKDNGFTTVYCHWGVEYSTYADERIQSLAREFIDLGADAVIGAHPHVIQQREWYKGRPIYYSLGNLVMDQYFDEDVRNGLLVELHIQNSNIRTIEIPTYLDVSGKTTLKID